MPNYLAFLKNYSDPQEHTDSGKSLSDEDSNADFLPSVF